VPDRTGQVSVTLTYRTPHACPNPGWWVPSFTVLARVPVPAGMRTLRFTQMIDPGTLAEATQSLCGGSAGT